MKKFIFLIIGITTLMSCQQPKSDKNKIEAQIIAYQRQVAGINQKIIALQQKLDELKFKDKSNAPAGLKFKVKTEKVHPTLFKHYFVASGEVQAVNETFVSPEVNGQVIKIFVTEGDKVKKGQLLARLETDVIENNINELKASLSLAKLTYSKQNELWKKHIGSEMQYLQAKTNKESMEGKLKILQTQYDKSFIHAPLSGYVEAVNLKEGELATPGVRFIHIINMDSMYINAQLSETYLPVIKLGDLLDLRFSTFPSIHLREPVVILGNIVNKQSRTFTVQLKIKNPNKVLKPNLLATLRINDYSNPDAIAVPSVLIKENIQGYYLFVVAQKSGTTIARKRYVKIGKSAGDETEIISGLQQGDVIITDGYNNVNDGTLIEIQ